VPVILLAFSGATVMLSGSLLIGLKRPFSGFFADGIFRPLVLVAALLGAVGIVNQDDAFTYMIWGAAIGYVVIALVQFGFTIVAWSAVPGADAEVRPREGRRWWRFALPWMLIALATDFFFDINLAAAQPDSQSRRAGDFWCLHAHFRAGIVWRLGRLCRFHARHVRERSQGRPQRFSPQGGRRQYGGDGAFGRAVLHHGAGCADCAAVLRPRIYGRRRAAGCALPGAGGAFGARAGPLAGAVHP
jgi:hypothetical protein